MRIGVRTGIIEPRARLNENRNGVTSWRS